MSAPATIPLRHPGATELDALLEELGRRRFLIHSFRSDRDGPEILAGLHRWEACADVVVVCHEHHAIAYRVPAGPAIDPFDPPRVYWWYSASAVWTLRALFTLAPPDHPDAPAGLTDAPPGCGVPATHRIPVRIRRRAF
jgi:hypothetical protein